MVLSWRTDIDLCVVSIRMACTPYSVMTSNSSAVYNRNNRGPRTDPCGTPKSNCNFTERRYVCCKLCWIHSTLKSIAKQNCRSHPLSYGAFFCWLIISAALKDFCKLVQICRVGTVCAILDVTWRWCSIVLYWKFLHFRKWCSNVTKTWQKPLHWVVLARRHVYSIVYLPCLLNTKLTCIVQPLFALSVWQQVSRAKCKLHDAIWIEQLRLMWLT